MTPEELSIRLAGPLPSPRLLDVRQPEEHQFAALPESKLIPLDELGERWEELREWQNQEVVVYCHHGIRSARAIGFLRSCGFTQLLNLTGGIDRWSLEVDGRIPRY